MWFHKGFDSIVFAALLKAKITIADFFFGSLQLSAMLSPSKCSRNCNILYCGYYLDYNIFFGKKSYAEPVGASLFCLVSLLKQPLPHQYLDHDNNVLEFTGFISLYMSSNPHSFSWQVMQGCIMGRNHFWRSFLIFIHLIFLMVLIIR